MQKFACHYMCKFGMQRYTFSKQIRPLEQILHQNMFHLSHSFNRLANLCLNLSHKSNFCSLVFVSSLFGATAVIGHCVKLAPLILLLLLLLFC